MFAPVPYMPTLSAVSDSSPIALPSSSASSVLNEEATIGLQGKANLEPLMTLLPVLTHTGPLAHLYPGAETLSAPNTDMLPRRIISACSW